MKQVVFVRHGQSSWNLANRFTGWTDVDLSERGVEEARQAGVALKTAGYEFDIAFTSYLKRAIRTLWLIQDEMDLMWIPVDTDWRLNERHYGALQGLDKKQTVEKHGAEQVQQWRRGYAIRPPALEVQDGRHPIHDPRYRNLSNPPGSESLADTLERVVPYWSEKIVPQLESGHRPIIVAHGNSLRALVKYLDNIDEDEIMGLNIPTGIPLVYEFDDALHATNHFYLANEDKLASAVKEVADQTATK
ncbi:MAG: 2,3-diphosphoglycerate-dependent phosphoglycerate mutase [Gammaproteobacteria bacterium]|nr:2,3-diphosphoglycerate-dependent phosphoglycerate mutase [Gammaproteobacteria bacterium]